MIYGTDIIRELLDSYENSRNFAGCTGRSVYLKKSYTLPDCESVYYDDLLKELLEIQLKGLVEVDWKIKNKVVNKIRLKLDNVDKAYDFVGTENKHSALERARASALEAKQVICDGWIKEYLDDSLSDFAQNKLTGIWKEDSSTVNDVISALKLIFTLDGKSISMRAASVRLYSDSKHFERNIKKYIISIAKKYEPVISEAEDDISEREILDQLGIIKMSEIFEFCGKIKIYYKSGAVDYSPIKNGACISADCLSEIEKTELCKTERILFIENKTNYTEYCLNNRKDSELVILHGGLYSPAKADFFKLISNAVTNEKVLYWGDIDMGGFNMYCRLKENIFPMLKPYNMDRISFESHMKSGLKRSSEYINKINLLYNNKRYSDFFDVIKLISERKITIEQESFL